ncbi:hypothetical protein GCM10009541_37570 [Micromonospora gifhornensis]|uniref:Uncharacterized protein n=1 Tax=Micromonospora gifhornensis TaxID=84594 RepID=A0ABQ4IK63_9ACTN|nr:hypothetical protein Vgi01_49860 [Micromonospora gifhornensis]
MQDDPVTADHSVEPSAIRVELRRVVVPEAVVLDRHPIVRPSKIETGEEPALGRHHPLGTRTRQPGQHEPNPSAGLLRRLGTGIRQVDRRERAAARRNYAARCG